MPDSSSLRQIYNIVRSNNSWVGGGTTAGGSLHHGSQQHLGLGSFVLEGDGERGIRKRENRENKGKERRKTEGDGEQNLRGEVET